MNAGEWSEWVNQVKAFASSKGCLLKKVIVSVSREVDLYTAWASGGGDSIKLEPKKEPTVNGIPIKFTTTLDSNRSLFLFQPEDVTSDRVQSPSSKAR